MQRPSSFALCIPPTLFALVLSCVPVSFADDPLVDAFESLMSASSVCSFHVTARTFECDADFDVQQNRDLYYAEGTLRRRPQNALLIPRRIQFKLIYDYRAREWSMLNISDRGAFMRSEFEYDPEPGLLVAIPELFQAGPFGFEFERFFRGVVTEERFLDRPLMPLKGNDAIVRRQDEVDDSLFWVDLHHDLRRLASMGLRRSKDREDSIELTWSKEGERVFPQKVTRRSRVLGTTSSETYHFSKYKADSTLPYTSIEDFHRNYRFGSKVEFADPSRPKANPTWVTVGGQVAQKSRKWFTPSGPRVRPNEPQRSSPTVRRQTREASRYFQ